MSELIKHENNEASFNITIEWSDFKAATKKAFQQEKNKFKVPGFRKGKAPQNIIEKQYGSEVFYDDAINILFREHYPKALDELELEPVDRPNLDIKDIKQGEAVVLEFKVTTKPSVELGDYKGLELKVPVEEVTDEMVDAELTKEQDMNARMITVSDRAAENGDTVVIDYKGSIDGKYFEGGSAENTHLALGSNQFIPGFEEQLVGVETGAEVKVEVTFPEEYQAEELAGKDAIFEVTVHEIKGKELPEIDDEFIKDISEFDTIDEYKADKRRELEENAKKSHEMKLREAALEAAVDNALVDIPDVMIENEISYMIEDMKRQLSMYGLDIDTYLAMNNSSMEEMVEQMHPEAESKVKSSLVLEAVVAAEELAISSEDVDKEIARIAESEKKTVEEIKPLVEHNDFQAIKNYLLPKKAIDFLVDSAKVEL